jgi:ribosomal-protein-alanine N-acetyltransferase
LIIGPAEEKDLPEIMEIEAGSFAQPWTQTQFLSELSKTPPTIYVIRQGPAGSVLGYICFWVIVDEFQVINLAIHPAFRRQGLGSRLLRFLFDLAIEKKAPDIFLEVRPSNQEALELYRALGFKTLYRRPRYYALEGEDALVMQWSLH